MAEIIEDITPEISKGVEFLRHYLGKEGQSLLKEVVPKNGEIASFEFRLPEDYLGISRTLCIGFNKGFPITGLHLQVKPSAWLKWPHVMPKSICLYGFGEKPSGISPELVVYDALQRFRKLLQLVLPNSNEYTRNKEFTSEISPYWQMQLSGNKQQLILLEHPSESCELFVLTDQRRVSSKTRTVWLAKNARGLENHLTRLFNRREKVSAPAEASFFVRLNSFPNIEIPSQDQIFSWLSGHISQEDELLLSDWNLKSTFYPIRWLLLEIPGANPPNIQAIVLRHKGIKYDSYHIYGRRAARRGVITRVLEPLASLEYCSVHLLSKSTIHSRDALLVNKELNNKKVAIIGTGSLGSSVVMQLVRAGVSNLTLIDPDKFESANIGRHVLGIDDLGHNKTDALKERIQKDIPFVNIKSIPRFIQYELIDQIKLLDDMDVIVITSADWLSEELIWFLRDLKEKKWALIQGWTEPYAIVGHILVVPSNNSSDGRYMFDHNGNFKYRFTDWPDNGVIALPGCGHGFIPGGPIGVNSIANSIAQTTIDVLTGEIKETVWISSIGDIEKIGQAKGKYIGPSIPAGCKQMVISQAWPEMERNDES